MPTVSFVKPYCLDLTAVVAAVTGAGDGEAGEQPAVQLQAAAAHAGAGEEGS